MQEKFSYQQQTIKNGNNFCSGIEFEWIPDKQGNQKLQWLNEITHNPHKFQNGGGQIHKIPNPMIKTKVLAKYYK